MTGPLWRNPGLSGTGAKAMLGAFFSAVAYARRTAPSPAHIDRLLARHWRRFDAVLDDDEEAFVDRHGLPAGAAAPPLGHGSSAYGEVTRVGARQLFAAFGLDSGGRHCSFADLGSGTGALVAQAWLELPYLERSVGVELSPTRHAAATRSWGRLAADDSAAELLRRPGEPEFTLGSMLECGLCGLTHVDP